MLIEQGTVTALITALTAVCAGIGAVLTGMLRSYKERVKSLEVERTRLETALQVSRQETDVARAKTDEVREQKDLVIARLEAAREADRLDHEADMQRRTQEAGGQQ